MKPTMIKHFISDVVGFINHVKMAMSGTSHLNNVTVTLYELKRPEKVTHSITSHRQRVKRKKSGSWGWNVQCRIITRLANTFTCSAA
ncbi:hypothetical protein AAFF_G00172680 [Aldrovandia affinis]|uniref:Uncharacterized protein n=1 Tax=Aldrovandia affinis TaxID=143900 RepID=A0AAD7T008_9TELE|nr:hypothetical protein AAFF_G00172680 [Aldrovandia affinis]